MTSARCGYCDSLYRPEKNSDGVRVFDQPGELLCPICQVPLMHATNARRRILYCTHCQGSLIAMPVFVELVAALRARRGNATDIALPPDPHELDRVVFCPRCGRRMDTHYYAGGQRDHRRLLLLRAQLVRPRRIDGHRSRAGPLAFPASRCRRAVAALPSGGGNIPAAPNGALFSSTAPALHRAPKHPPDRA